MITLKQTAEILAATPEMLQHIENCGRTCYKSHDKITDGSAERFIGMLIRRGHESVLEHGSITVKLITNRAIANELVRHRIASYSQESTRYCTYRNEVAFIKPEFKNKAAEGIWLNHCRHSEWDYKLMLENGEAPETARDILPLCLATEIVVTANIREWRNILKQRTAAAAHPQIRELMGKVLDLFLKDYAVLFSDIREAE